MIADVITLEYYQRQLATPKKRKRLTRRISVGGSEYIWEPEERRRRITIRSAKGSPASIRLVSLFITVMPRHIAGCIEYAIKLGWHPESKEQIWLGCRGTAELFEFLEVEPNARWTENTETGEWVCTDGGGVSPGTFVARQPPNA